MKTLGLNHREWEEVRCRESRKGRWSWFIDSLVGHGFYFMSTWNPNGRVLNKKMTWLVYNLRRSLSAARWRMDVGEANSGSRMPNWEAISVGTRDDGGFSWAGQRWRDLRGDMASVKASWAAARAQVSWFVQLGPFNGPFLDGARGKGRWLAGKWINPYKSLNRTRCWS